MTWGHRQVLGSIFLLSAAACGGEGDDHGGGPDVGPLPEPLPADLGTGPERTGAPGFQPTFEMVEAGEGVLMGTGGQGAVYHAPIAVRVPDADLADFPRPVRVRGEGRRQSDGLLVARVSTFSILQSYEGSDLITDTPVRVLLCPAPVGESLLGTPIDLTLRLEDDDGNVFAEGELSFSILCPDALCQRICDGRA